jgi:high affinity Mn2+ porin
LAAFFHFNFFESRASSPRVPVVSTPRAVSRRAIGVLTLLGCYSTVAGSNPSELPLAPETSRDGFAVYEPTNRSGPVGGPFFTDFTDMASDRGSMPVPAPAPSPPPDTKDDAEQGSRFGWPTDDESRFVARGQATYAWIRKFGFDAPYTGPQSLVTHPESSYTLSFTGFFGTRLWKGGELYIDPEAFQAHPLSNLFGLAGIQNGELQKASGVEIRAYFARAFIRQSFDFGGESREVPAGFNQLATHYDSRRLVFSVGKFPLTDFFERSSYANDPRTQFMNWALITYGAYDYAADARGYDIGAIAELYWDDWAFRAGRGMEPIIANGRSLHYNLFRRHGDQVEIEHDHVFHGQPGAVRVLVYRNLANAGNYRESVALAAASGTIPDITATRSLEAKTGYGVSVEQSLSPSVALWARGMWCDCNVEEYAFTEIDNSMSAGMSIKGSLWQRSHDTVGAAFSLNGLSPAHRAYLAAGGLGGFLGDGRLNYTREQDYEIYYSALVYRGVHLTLDYQRVVNPGYNADRHGPVHMVGGRVHFEF